MSFAFVGRIVQSLKGFYNGINPATLTGAIDVVIVKQPDGTYHSSPFHVRFGKLGVLRSREKVVDIEINGEPIDLHMKLGEAGEAFFVQEIESEDDHDIAELVQLATSPLPSCESLMEEGVKQLHRQVEKEEASQAHSLSHKAGSGRESSNTSSAATSPRLAAVGGGQMTIQEVGGNKPRRKVLKKKKQHQKQQHHHIHKPTATAATGAISVSTGPSNSGRSGIRSVSMPEGVTDEIAMFDFDESTSDESYNDDHHTTTSGDVFPTSANTGTSASLEGSGRWKAGNLHSTSSPDVQGMCLQGTTSHRRMSSMGNNSYIIPTPFSDPETSPICSPRASRPSTPKSDTEVDKQHSEERSDLMENSATWAWGKLPTNLPASPSAGGDNSRCEDSSGGVVLVASSDGSSEKDDSDHAAKSSTGFMSIWNKSSPPPSTAQPPSKPDSLEGIYLEDLTSMDDPEMARIYLGQPREKEEDTESGRGPSLPQSPNSVEGAIGGPSVSFTMSEVRHLGPVALSLCGGLDHPESLSLDKFMQKVVTFEDLAQNPNITVNPDLVVKIHDKFYNWTTAGPMVLSQIVFHKQLPDPAVKDLEKEYMPKKSKRKKGWFSWGRSTEAQEEAGMQEAGATSAPSDAAAATTPGEVTSSASSQTLTETAVLEEGEALSSNVESPGSTPPQSNTGTPRKHKAQRPQREEATTTSTETDTDQSEKEASSSLTSAAAKPPSSPQQKSTPKEVTPSTTASTTPVAAMTVANDDDNNVTLDLGDDTTAVVIETETETETNQESPRFDDETLDAFHERRRRHSSHSSASGRNRHERFIKSLRLTNDQISKMGLREGHNEIIFSVTTQYQGTTRCVSSVYLWNYDDKIVISDIDGTITKSDVLGQIMPIIGRDWWQSGVAQLFTRINENGYKLIYLSARAIGQSRSTKDMLKSIRQGGLVLPNGPLFLNPTSLFSAFHREVITKNPEEFKISCLKDIADLFPSTPFIAGFGNKLNDVIAYRALDIPKSRIFTINPQGQLRHDLSLTFKSSYTDMSDLVDHLFPARDHVDRGAASEFTGVTYWRQPIQVLTDAELSLLSGGAIQISSLPGANSAGTVATAAGAGTVAVVKVSDTVLDLRIEAPKQ